MEKSNKQKINLGLFIITSIIILIGFLYFIGNQQNLFNKTFKIYTVFKNINGLQTGNNVRYSGMVVGTIKDITMVNDTSIAVGMVIQDKMHRHLKKNAIAIIGTNGLVGSMIINIMPGKGTSTLLKSGDTIKSYTKISTNQMLTTLNTTNDNAALLTGNLLKITNEINEGKGTLGLLIKDSEMASNLKQTIKNLKIASGDASKTIGKFKNIISSVHYDKSVASVLFSDSAAAIKIKTVIDNLDASSYVIDTVLTNLNTIVLNIKNGRGTLNTIVNDSILAKNIDKTILNINKGSVLLNENLKALKHSFLVRRYFKKLEKKKHKK